ncbi:MAG: TauD/TfdA family dioxygenase [Acidimicrobiales bacterium]|nr:TauD/TfdA family dioxygenase [Acidimicrobiales bacterium]
MTTTLMIEPQTRAIGATVRGLDLRDAVSDETLAALRAALVEHLVLCFPDQGAMTPDHQLAFARRWGTLEPHPYVEPIEGYPEVMRIYDPNPITETWHADFTYAEQPPAFSFLHAQVIPPLGGDTMFSSAYLAFEGLSDGLRECLRHLRAFHQGTELALSKGLTLDDIQRVHPVVWVHPDTGREALFVNGNYVKHFDGWTAEESAPLLSFLYDQFARPEYTYRHRWHDGDLLVWDNRCTQHRVVGDTDGAPRDLHRVTEGTPHPA